MTDVKGHPGWKEWKDSRDKVCKHRRDCLNLFHMIEIILLNVYSFCLSIFRNRALHLLHSHHDWESPSKLHDTQHVYALFYSTAVT